MTPTLEQAIAAQGRPAEKLQGLCFGLYACGWDFITSPICALVLLLAAGVSALIYIWP